jgi:hypothetical protein
MIMTEDKARKIATRQRMAATGEPYSVARHAVEDEHASPAEPPDRMVRDAGGGRGADPSQSEPPPSNKTSDHEQMEGARRLAGQARTVAEQARSRAEQLERLAEEAEEAADRAEEAAGEAENLAGDSEDGPPRWHQRVSRPANPPRPPRPPRLPRPPRPHGVRPHGPHGQDDWWQQRPDPAERLQERVDQFIQRLSVARDQADRLISAAERIFIPARSERVHSEPVHSERAHSEPSSGESGPADPA